MNSNKNKETGQAQTDPMSVTVWPAPNPPHGPVDERFMRHHYGASGYVPPPAAEEDKMKYPPLIQSSLILNEGEIRTLRRILEKEWINPNDEQAYELVKKIFRTINDMDSRTNNVYE